MNLILFSHNGDCHIYICVCVCVWSVSCIGVQKMRLIYIIKASFICVVLIIVLDAFDLKKRQEEEEEG